MIAPNEPTSEIEDQRCRPFLLLPREIDPHDLTGLLESVLEPLGTGGVLVRGSERLGEPQLSRLLLRCHGAGWALFVDQPGPQHAGSGIDGGLVPARPGAIDRVRSWLGEAAILLAEAGLSRHVAMSSGEEGADVILFGHLDGRDRREAAMAEGETLEDCIAWWQELFVLPSIACAPAPADIEGLARAGADFVALDREVWNEAGAAKAAASALAERFDAVNRERTAGLTENR
ncbi:MAG: hypothetical protein ACFB6S_10865 [Geminicoccaceae bacterium]